MKAFKTRLLLILVFLSFQFVYGGKRDLLRVHPSRLQDKIQLARLENQKKANDLNLLIVEKKRIKNQRIKKNSIGYNSLNQYDWDESEF